MLAISADIPKVASGPDSAPFLWLLRELQEGRNGALLTITRVHGSAPRPVGTHMAVGVGARFTGHLSGGCVEPAIAREAEGVIAGGQSRILRFGKGSPFFDIRFPCGGGIDVLAWPGMSADLIEIVLARLAQRQAFTLAFTVGTNQAAILDEILPNGWADETFHRTYLPVTRLSLAGRGPELEAVVRLGAALGYEIDVATPDPDTAQRIAPLAAAVRLMTSPSDIKAMLTDPWTATVLLFHEREWEEPILAQRLGGPHFYIGALGSERTQAARRERLLAKGYDPTQVDRIAGPIGVIPQARDPSTLALSILGEIALRRREADEQFGGAVND